MHKNSWRQVNDGAKRRVRGLWIRQGTYSVQTTIKDTATGVKRVRRVSLAAKTLPDAKVEMSVLLKTIADGGTIEGNRGPTFADYRAHYIECAGKSPRTLINEDHFLRQWEKFLGANSRVTDISATNVLAYRHAAQIRHPKPLSNRTINLHVRALIQLLKMAQLEGHIKDIPTRGIKQLKEIDKEKTLFSEEHLKAICDEAINNHPRTGKQLADWITLAMWSGGRVTELLRLKWENVEWEKRQLVFPALNTKSGYERRVNFNTELEKHLRAMKENANPQDELLFRSFRTNKEITSFKKTLGAIRQKLDFHNFTPHSTRHFFISQCVMRGIDYLSIARWVGHKDGGVLIGRIYGHLNDAHLVAQAAKLTF
jgi:integrase